MNLNEIERLAREAIGLVFEKTKPKAGDWIVHNGKAFPSKGWLKLGDRTWSPSDVMRDKDVLIADYIASVSPDVVLKMIDRIRAADELIDLMLSDAASYMDLKVLNSVDKYRQLSEGE